MRSSINKKPDGSLQDLIQNKFYGINNTTRQNAPYSGLNSNYNYIQSYGYSQPYQQTYDTSQSNSYDRYNNQNTNGCSEQAWSTYNQPEWTQVDKDLEYEHLVREQGYHDGCNMDDFNEEYETNMRMLASVDLDKLTGKKRRYMKWKMKQMERQHTVMENMAPAKKSLFNNAQPVSSGKGSSLLKKMGWCPGQGLGRNNTGIVEPSKLMKFKWDRKGLSAKNERKPAPAPNKPKVKSIVTADGKSPVMILEEYCSKKKIMPPNYTVIKEDGPPHNRYFTLTVSVEGKRYTGESKLSKKAAKADVAYKCAKAIGLITE